MGFRGVKNGLTATLSIIGQLRRGIYGALDIFRSLCSFLFDGVNEKIDVGRQLNVQTSGSDPLTLIIEVKPLSIAGNIYFITRWGTTITTNRDFNLRNSSGFITAHYVKTSTNQYVSNTSSAVLTANNWYHIVCTIIPLSSGTGRARIWLNGVEQSMTVATETGTPDSIRNGGEPILIGDIVQGGGALNGYVNQWAIVKTGTPTQAEIDALYNGGNPGLVSNVFPASEILEEIYPQDSIFENNQWSTINYPYISNSRGYLFDGVDESISTTYTLPQLSTSAFSVTTLVDLTSLTVTKGITGDYTGNDSNSLFTLSITTTAFRVVYGRENTVGNRIIVDTTGITPTANQWYLITVTYNGNGLASGFKIYVNGVNITTTATENALSGNPNVNRGPLYIGRIGQTGDLTNGINNFVSISQTELTSQNVSDIWNNSHVLLPSTISGISTTSEWNYNSDTFGGLNYTVIDSVGSNNGITINMEEFDLLHSNHPGGGRSINMEVSDLDCTVKPS